MGFDSAWHWLILLAIIVLIFGTGKLGKVGADIGGAVRGFKDALRGADSLTDGREPSIKTSPDQTRISPEPVMTREPADKAAKSAATTG